VPYLALSVLNYVAYLRYSEPPDPLKNLLITQYFLVGIGLYYYGHGLMRLKKWFPWAGLALSAFLIALHHYELRPVPVLYEIVDPALTGLAVFFLAFSEWKVRVKYDLSYGVYVLHFPLIQMTLAYGLFAGRPYALFAAAMMAGVTLLAWLSYRFVESPFIRLARNTTRPTPGLKQW
jgi:peptidoglycan/LPS O-acetylase OafA/YrhL